jgi:hypothetical protein
VDEHFADEIAGDLERRPIVERAREHRVSGTFCSTCLP